MEHEIEKERGSEIIQLAFAIPILILLFGLCAQLCVWMATSIQFANAADYVASTVDLDTLSESGIGSPNSERVIAQAISEKAVGIDADDVKVSDVEIVQASEGLHTARGADTDQSQNSVATLYESASHGQLTFTASYTSPCFISGFDGLRLDGTWQRDRLLSKISEIRYDLG